jgi:hypothetical protein
MFISLFQNWIGQTQPRVVKIDGDYLYLHTASPIESGGKKVNRIGNGSALRKTNRSFNPLTLVAPTTSFFT